MCLPFIMESLTFPLYSFDDGITFTMETVSVILCQRRKNKEANSLKQQNRSQN